MGWSWNSPLAWERSRDSPVDESRKPTFFHRQHWMDRMPYRFVSRRSFKSLITGIGCLAIGFWSVVLQAGDRPGATTAPAVSVFDVTKFGAVGDGKTNDVASIQKAIDQCASSGGGIVQIPTGIYFGCGINLKSHVTLQLDDGAVLQGPSAISDFPVHAKSADWSGGFYGVVNAEDATDIAITGKGRIDGAGQNSWKMEHDAVAAGKAAGTHLKPGGSYISRPRLVQFSRCKNVSVTGVTLSNSHIFHMIFCTCESVNIDGVTILSPADSPETDGIDIRETRHVKITHCRVENGDDNVAISTTGSPRDRSVFLSEDVEVSDCSFGHGHGVSIGSPTGGNIRNVRVHDCTFAGTTNGIRIKSVRDRGGLVEDIHYDNLKMTDVKWVIVFNAYYQTPPATDPGEPITPRTPMFRNIRVTNLTATSPKSAGMIFGLPEVPISDVVLENVSISAGTGLVIQNAKGIVLKNVNVQAKTGEGLLIKDADVKQDK
jgi:hypothetical protein